MTDKGKRPDTSLLSTNSSGFRTVLKQALVRKRAYPHEPENVEQQMTADLISDIRALGFQDFHTLLAFVNAGVTGKDDDNNLLLENLVQLLSKLPATSKHGKQLTDALLGQLWTALDHPPQTSLAEEFRYRSADGSGNNIHQPQLGAAGSAYARTVPPMTMQPPNQPDPSFIFDSLMARGKTFEPHPQGISSVLFYLATIIIHDIFQTSSPDYNINMTSSYLDLSPLYGRNETEQLTVRTMKDGLLRPDCFSSKRILGFPPGCGVMLIMFNRFHNYVVTQLAKINENGRFNKPSPRLSGEALEASWKEYDNDLFQTGRLITCGLYGNIILKDYVRTILALNRVDTTWNLDPRSNAEKNLFSHPSPQAVGNQVSAEFNLIYRWHSSVSEKDEQWTVDEFRRLLDGKDPEEAKLEEVLRALAKFESSLPDEPEKRHFAGLVRQEDGSYDDERLVNIFQESVEDVAGSFGANKVPKSLKSIEVLGIMQARYWNLATLNEFRAYMGLTRHTTFEDINPDPAVARKLRDLYDSPDAVELYPGLVAEKPKPPMSPGSGLCVNYTISRAILSDAVALIRGDRFYTLDYTPKNITNWGYHEANSDLAVNKGHVFHKLVLRAFPNAGLAPNSIYAHFPLVVPSENMKIHQSLGSAGRYSWDKPNNGKEQVVFRSHKSVKAILSDNESFQRVSSISGSAPKLGLGDRDNEMPSTKQKFVYKPEGWAKEIRTFCLSKVEELLRERGVPREVNGQSTHEVDIVRDVISVTATHLVSSMFNLPLQTSANPDGKYSEVELFDLLYTIFAGSSFDPDVATAFARREKSEEAAQQVGSNIVATAKTGGLSGLAKRIKSLMHGSAGTGPSLPSFGSLLVRQLVDMADSLDGAVFGFLLPMASSSVVGYTALLSSCLEYYLGDGIAHLPDLNRLANTDTQDADDALSRYILEGSRLRGGIGLVRQVSSPKTITDNPPVEIRNPVTVDAVSATKTFLLKPGDRVILDLASASLDPEAFPDPELIKLDRPIESYLACGVDPQESLGTDMDRVVATSIFKAILRHRELKRAIGKRVGVKSFPTTVWDGQVGRSRLEFEGLRTYLTDDERSFQPVPSSLRIVFVDQM